MADGYYISIRRRPVPTKFYYPPHEVGSENPVNNNWQQDNQRDWNNQRWKGKWYQY
jgi:hypothetical protein